MVESDYIQITKNSAVLGETSSWRRLEDSLK